MHVINASYPLAVELSPAEDVPIHAHKDLLMLSYEDVFLNDPRMHRFLPNATKYVGESRRQLRVLLLRDPYNHLASLLKHDATYKSASHFTSKLYTDMWKQYA